MSGRSMLKTTARLIVMMFEYYLTKIETPVRFSPDPGVGKGCGPVVMQYNHLVYCISISFIELILHNKVPVLTGKGVLIEVGFVFGPLPTQ